MTLICGLLMVGWSVIDGVGGSKLEINWRYVVDRWQ